MGPCPNCGSYEYDECEYCTFEPNVPMMINDDGFIHSGSPAAIVAELALELNIKFKGE